jgi:hypothetical protein
MFRATGKGKVDVVVENRVAGILEALLYNFDFDDFYGRQFRPLKVEHSKFLDDKVIPLLENDRGQIWLRGSASRIGTDAWNMETSMIRAGTVQAYLHDHGVLSGQVQPHAVGNRLAATHAKDDEHDRSVQLWVFPKFKFAPPPPRRVPPSPKVSQNFKLAVLTGLSAALSAKVTNFLKGGVTRGLAADMIFFIVWDTTNNLSCIYVYIGVGLGVGLSITPKVGGTTHGPWNSFTTDKAIGVWQFGRLSRITTAAVLFWSVNWIFIRTPPGVKDVYETIDTGTTLGAGASTTVGEFILVDGPGPFNGP